MALSDLLVFFVFVPSLALFYFIFYFCFLPFILCCPWFGLMIDAGKATVLHCSMEKLRVTPLRL